VAVEKVGFSKKSRKSGDGKCSGEWGKSSVELPDAIQFLEIPSERVFQQPQDFSTSIRAKDLWPSDFITLLLLTVAQIITLG
jgi:hypothetical protein